MYGQLGRAKLRPLKRRQHERGRTNLNHQLLSAIEWWLQLLNSQIPEAIPLSVDQWPTVISYSDGEGDAAGVGVAI